MSDELDRKYDEAVARHREKVGPEVQADFDARVWFSISESCVSRHHAYLGHCPYCHARLPA